MKKRKPPIFLATALLIVVILGVFVNIAITKQNQSPEEAQKQAQQQQAASSSPTMDSKPRPNVTQGNVASNVKSLMNGGQSSPKPSKMGPMGMMGKDRSAIMMPSMGSSKPMPNDSGISTHWYEHDSAAGQR